MIQITIEEILAGESERLEFKEDIPARSEKYMKTVVAFANSNGGRLVFGVRDATLDIVGIDRDVLFEKIDAITNAIWGSCEPKILADVYAQQIDGKNIIVADIPKGMQVPYSIKGLGIWDGTFIRVSGTTRLAPEYMIKEMVLESMNQSFDRKKVDRVLSEGEINALCERLYQHALEIAPEADKNKVRRISKAQLISFGLVIEENGIYYATNGFQLLDGKMDDYEDAYIQCAVFKGNDRGIFITRKDIRGPIDLQVEEATSFALQNIRLGSRIEGIYRQDFYELPTDSIREMIANAVCHRSYLADGKIQVALFDDRLEVTTPGMLSRDITIEKMENGQSLLKNKGIAAAFSYMHIIEGWGSGIPKILREAAEYHLKKPELIDMGGAFRINLFRREFDIDRHGVIDPKNEVLVTEVHDSNRDANDANHDTNGANHDANDANHDANGANLDSALANRIISIIMEQPSISQSEIADKLAISRRTVQRAMSTLKESGIIERIGSTRGFWKIL